MNTLLLYLAMVAHTSFFQPAKPPAFDGHWEAYSKYDPSKVIGTLDIEKYLGKNYSCKYSYQNDEKEQGSDEYCNIFGFTMMGVYDGKSALVTDMKGIVFTYHADTDIIVTTADGSDPFFHSPNCIGGIFMRVRK